MIIDVGVRIFSNIPEQKIIKGRWRALQQGGVYPNKTSGVDTNFWLLVHVLPGLNEGGACKQSTILS